MNHLAAFLLFFSLVPAGEKGPPVSPLYPVTCLLETVAAKKRLPLRAEVPVPTVYLESKTPLQQFQDAIEPQWGQRPDVFLNAYVKDRNEIYVIDDSAYYRRTNRYLDDSLVHELTHYMQVKYQDADLQNDDSLEAEAVELQTWFRETYMRPGLNPCASPASPLNNKLE